MQDSSFPSELPYDPADLVDLLADRVRHLSDENLVEALAPVLDRRPVKPLVEYVARRCTRGSEQQLELTFHLSERRLRSTHVGHKAIGNQELEELARVA